MELKTLDEIEDFNKLNPNFVDRDKVKQEAIKWIKEDMKNSIFEPSEIRPKPWTDYGASIMPNGKYCKCEPEDICAFHSNFKFKKFFNITEEDLK
ncbi:MAG: hypothetical protein QQN41_00180 [Nitrosopumilus sp.]